MKLSQRHREGQIWQYPNTCTALVVMTWFKQLPIVVWPQSLGVDFKITYIQISLFTITLLVCHITEVVLLTNIWLNVWNAYLNDFPNNFYLNWKWVIIGAWPGAQTVKSMGAYSPIYEYHGKGSCLVFWTKGCGKNTALGLIVGHVTSQIIWVFSTSELVDFSSKFHFACSNVYFKQKCCFLVNTGHIKMSLDDNIFGDGSP